ncbi:hypothetical protein [Arthrobacter methylotrophus]|uniref:hypothetical protein n=1 Tax=Arthrobacter methylotrophus TaxID=121291 RepID=UPI0031E57B92
MRPPAGTATKQYLQRVACLRFGDVTFHNAIGGASVLRITALKAASDLAGTAGEDLRDRCPVTQDARRQTSAGSLAIQHSSVCPGDGFPSRAYS